MLERVALQRLHTPVCTRAEKRQKTVQNSVCPFEKTFSNEHDMSFKITTVKMNSGDFTEAPVILKLIWKSLVVPVGYYTVKNEEHW